MSKYVFWKDSLHGPIMQILHHENTLTEHDVKLGIAPPVEMKLEHYHLSMQHLKGLYPCPERAKIPKNKKVEI
jgi:hypothetical protein